MFPSDFILYRVPFIIILFSLFLVLSVVLFFLRKKRLKHPPQLLIQSLRNEDLLDDPISEFLRLVALSSHLEILIRKSKLIREFKCTTRMSENTVARLKKFPMFNEMEEKGILNRRRIVHLALEIDHQPKDEFSKIVCPDHDLLVELYHILHNITIDYFLLLEKHSIITFYDYQKLIRKYDCNFQMRLLGTFSEMFREIIDETPNWR